MKAIDLPNGIRRAILGLQRPATTCTPRRRLPIARHHASLPIRPFSSITARHAGIQLPDGDESSSLQDSSGTFMPGELPSENEIQQDFTAAKEIDFDDGIDSSNISSKSTTPDGFRSIDLSIFAPKPFDRTQGAEQGHGEGEQALLERVRVVPASPSYFTSRPNFTDHYLEISALLRKYQLLPTIAASTTKTKTTWINLEGYGMYVEQENVPAGQFHSLIKMCKRLRNINPSLMPQDVQAALAKFITKELPRESNKRPSFVDPEGRAYGLGRRKAATARAWVVRGEGQVMVNGQSLSQYFSRIYQRESAIYPLKVLNIVGKYNVFAVVEGGGNTGQAEAMTLAIANALIVHEPSTKSRLREAGCITRDRRRVERKKPGHLKARKKPAWVKR